MGLKEPFGVVVGWVPVGRAWELRHPHPRLPSLQRLREAVEISRGLAHQPADRSAVFSRGGSKEAKACPHRL